MIMGMNQLGIVKRNIVRADKAAVEKLSRFGVATILHEPTRSQYSVNIR